MSPEGPTKTPSGPSWGPGSGFGYGYWACRGPAEAPLWVGDDRAGREEAPERYDPVVEVQAGWRRISGAGGPSPVAARVAVVLGALYWAYRDGDQIWVTERTSRDRPTGGVLHPVDKRAVRASAAAFFRELCGGREVASTAALAAAQLAWEGTAVPLGALVWLRWGRDGCGRLWWDPGGAAGGFVVFDEGSWHVEASPACWFRRPGDFPCVPVPESGGELDELWRFVPCEVADRPLVLAWMLGSSQPDADFAAGVLYLAGGEGTAKTTSAQAIARVAGSPAQPARLRRNDDWDLLYAANAAWTVLLDNVSALDADQADLLCTLVTGFAETVRTLYTTADTTTLALRRPVIMTGIAVGGLRPDLVQRMVPVRLRDIAPERRRGRRELSAELDRALPGPTGALFDLLAAVQGREAEAPTALPRLADLGAMAARADRLLGTSTLARLQLRQRQLTSEAVGDEDPFFAAMRARVTRAWSGTAAELHHLLDPAGELSRSHRDWPSAKGVSARLERHRQVLADAGWGIERVEVAAGHGGLIWALTPPA